MKVLEEESPFSGEELRYIRFHINHNQRLFIPRVSIAYLGSPSQNGAAELAAIHLLRSKNRAQEVFRRTPNDFYRLILESAFGFFGSLILNHRRKCDLLKDHLKRLKSLENGDASTFPHEELARKLVIDLSKSEMNLNLSELLREKKYAPGIIMGARFHGQILGKQLHHAILEERVSVPHLCELFLIRPGSSRRFFEERYSELLNWTSEVSLAPSKSETL
jgi:hypothetical protein